MGCDVHTCACMCKMVVVHDFAECHNQYLRSECREYG